MPHIHDDGFCLQFQNSSDVEIEEETSRLKEKAEESEEAWKQTLASFKEQALKMLNVSQEAYEVYLKKATVILQETSEQLKIQADKASEDLSVIAKELGEEGKVYLSAAAENSPEPVKDIVEMFASSTDDLKDVSEVLDFYVGIPYGKGFLFDGFLTLFLHFRGGYLISTLLFMIAKNRTIGNVSSGVSEPSSTLVCLIYESLSLAPELFFKFELGSLLTYAHL